MLKALVKHVLLCLPNIRHRYVRMMNMAGTTERDYGQNVVLTIWSEGVFVSLLKRLSLVYETHAKKINNNTLIIVFMVRGL